MISNEAKLVDHCPKTPPSRERRGFDDETWVHSTSTGRVDFRATGRLTALCGLSEGGLCRSGRPGRSCRHGWSRSTRVVWFSSTATSWSPSALAVAVYPTSGDDLSSCGGAIGQLGASQRAESQIALCQRSDCSISSSCLSMSVNSIARRRNWRTTAARRCSSSARRSSRPILCASVCMMVAPVDHGLVSVASQLCCLGQSVSHCGVGAANRMGSGRDRSGAGC